MSPSPQAVSHLRIEHAATPSETDLVDLDKILVDDALQVRIQGLDLTTVEAYTEVYRLNGERGMPPLVVFEVAGDTPGKKVLLLASGFHRLAAAAKAKLSKIPVLIRKGDRRAAHLYALLANGGHGLALTNADKRHLVEALLADEEWRQWSDRELASRAKVSPSFIGTMRKTVQGAQTEKRKSKDGAVRSTKGIQEAGKKRAADNKARKVKSDPKQDKAEPEELNEDLFKAPSGGIPTQPKIPEAVRADQKDETPVPLHERRYQRILDQIVDLIGLGGHIWRGTNNQLMALTLIMGCEDGPEPWNTELVKAAPGLLADQAAKDIAYHIEKRTNKLKLLPSIQEICSLFSIDYASLVINAENAVTQ